MIQTSRLRTTIAFAAVALLAACANSKKSDAPVELTKFQSTVKLTKVWSASLDGAPKLRIGLSTATDGKVVYAAGHDGKIVALDVATGKRLWESDTKLRLTAGPGVGEGIVVAGAGYGDVVALDAATGARKWKTRINSEPLAAPAIGGGVVLMRMGDGRLLALRVSDGSQAWSIEQQVPQLSLRGTAKPLIDGQIGYSGFDSGHVMAVSLGDGQTLWDVIVSPPSGRSALDRLNDMDSAVKVVDGDVYAASFHGKVVRIDRETGQQVWGHDVSSYAGIAADDDGLYVSGSNGELVKFGRRTGVEMWKQEVLAYRRLSPPVVLGSLLVVADYEGYVHALDVAKGELAGRVRALGARVSAAPLVIGDLLVMMDDAGKIVALRVEPSAAKS